MFECFLDGQNCSQAQHLLLFTEMNHAFCRVPESLVLRESKNAAKHHYTTILADKQQLL